MILWCQNTDVCSCFIAIKMTKTFLDASVGFRERKTNYIYSGERATTEASPVDFFQPYLAISVCFLFKCSVWVKKSLYTIDMRLIMLVSLGFPRGRIYNSKILRTLNSPLPNLPKLGLTLMTAYQWITDGFYTISPPSLFIRPCCISFFNCLFLFQWATFR